MFVELFAAARLGMLGRTANLAAPRTATLGITMIGASTAVSASVVSLITSPDYTRAPLTRIARRPDARRIV